MAEEIQVRTVRVELLRAGPAHNQLLSPLTPYLGVCDDAEAGVVHVPYEQHTFQRRMRAMRKDATADDDGLHPAPKDHLPELRELGVAMGCLLGSVPRLPGALTADPNGRATLVRLSLTLSASELAGLPFELAKVPIGPDAWTEQWLSLQGKVPVVVTRRTRNVSVAQDDWLESPRILFVAAGGAGSDEVPFDQHLQALVNAVQPFVMPDPDDRSESACHARLRPARPGPGPNARQMLGDMLTVLSNATLEGVMRECARRPYTHVHVLAHGRQDDRFGDRSHGLGLHPQDGVISGERLASVLTGVVRGRLHRPQVVTLATCNSGDVGDVVYPGASIAHALHQAGIPLVLASQVPLTFEASTLMTALFYEGLLWGEHPWVLMHRVRAALHGRLAPDDHDWASVVVYESLPTDQTEALDRAEFRQCSRALRVVAASGVQAPPDGPLQRGIQRLIERGGRHAMEAHKLRAELRLLEAWQAYRAAGEERRDSAAFRDAIFFSRWALEEARVDFERAVAGFLVNPGQGLNAPFRALVVQMTIGITLGRPLDMGWWTMAWHWTECTIAHSPSGEQRALAMGCAALLWLLRVGEDADRGAQASIEQRVEHWLYRMVQERGRAEEAILWTDAQLENIAEWWADASLHRGTTAGAAAGRSTPPPFPAAMQPAARRLLDLLRQMTAFTPLGEPLDDLPEPEPEPQPEARPAPAPPPLAAAPAPAPSRQLGKAAKAGADTVFDIEMLPVAQGDCLWIEWGSRKGARWRMLVDCGTAGSFDDALGPRIAALPEAQRRFELFVMSHIDGDHIGGGLKLLQQARALGVAFGDIWFNGRKHLEKKRMLGAKQGDAFSALLHDYGWPWNRWRDGNAIVRPEGQPLPSIELPGGMKLTLLSPVPGTLVQLAGTWDKELGRPTDKRLLAGRRYETSEDLDEIVRKAFEPDDSRPNGSSIALLAEFAGLRVLLGADAHADVLASAIRQLLPAGQQRLRLDAFKLPHHGSRGNLDMALMSLIDCPHYLVSTSGAIFDHPDREALARVVRGSARPATLWFNHPLPKKSHAYHALWQQPDFQEKWKFSAVYPAAGQVQVFSVAPNARASA